MAEAERIWRIPARLTPCWWVAAHSEDSRTIWIGPFDSEAEAATSWEYQNGKIWLGQEPTRVEVVTEAPKAFTAKAATCRQSEAWVTARWNWFSRHRDTLTAWTKPKACQILLPSERELSKDLLSNRLGGQAVLPSGHAWPTFKIADYSGTRKKTICALGTFVATLDLRERFDLGKNFPDAVSLFICTYDDLQKCYSNDFTFVHDEGIIVPLFAKDRLVQTAVPADGVQLEPVAADALEQPDFPGITVVLGHSTGLEKAAVLCDEIDQKEPRTSDWIHLCGLKIGGYEQYIQRDLRQTMKEKYPALEWHYIATWQDERISLGDSGELYIVAGYDRSAKTWRWHCASECF